MTKILAALAGLLFSQQLLAVPGPQITKMIETPASTFDMFLYRIYESAKCNNVVKNNNFDEADLCMSSIKYDADKNILTTFFRVLPSAEIMDDFVAQEPTERKATLLKLLENTARRVGALDQWGLLHSTPISHGWKVDVAEEKTFREEIAGRTSTALSTSYDGVVYVATRHHDGRIEFFTSK